jgi:NAD-dependent SIR2 family protein deacetylase
MSHGTTAAEPRAIEALARLLDGKRLAVLTGAGCSTESGIPDYRGPETLRRARNPIQGRDFVRSPDVRRRYWARAMIGWERFRAARPNAAHGALARLERGGALTGLVTQNVDGLHQAAGSERVIELHGSLAEVRCLQCGSVEPRDGVQRRLLASNPGFLERRAAIAPDGDADLPPEQVADFVVADCLHCGGALKPSVVFFGENVARPIVEAAYSVVDSAAALLIVGSSLAVFSGYRFLLRAAEQGKPTAIVNLGPARGSDRCAVHVDGPAGAVLPLLADALLDENSGAARGGAQGSSDQATSG